jgi:2'-hydroxyisoflavone reductase
MPVWVPDTAEDAGFSRFDISKAIQAGLKFRALQDTVHDAIVWAKARPAEYEWRAGLKPEREAELLNKM